MFAMSCGIYKDFTDVPLWQMDGEGDGRVIDGGDDTDEEPERAEAEGGAGAVGAAQQGDHKADDTKQPVKDDQDLSAMRKKCKHTIHLGCTILCKDGISDLCRIIYTMIVVIRKEHGTMRQNVGDLRQ